MDEWEYLVTSLAYVFAAKAAEQLTAFGKDGWELVSVTRSDREVTAYLKRRIR